MTKITSNRPKWLRLSNGSRCQIDRVGSIGVAEEKLTVFIKNSEGEIIISSIFESEEQLVDEIQKINEQLDA